MAADAQVLELKALIGYFDLDPNRAIALVLQASAALLGRAPVCCARGFGFV